MPDNITVNAQSSIRIAGEVIIYFDPYQITEASNDADVIFITHTHPDHFSPEDIRKVQKPDTVFVAPKSMEKELRGAGYTNVTLLAPGESAEVMGIPVEAVPAYNLHKPFHPKNNGWNGYIAVIGGQRVYVGGDTDATPEARAVSCDIALIPVGGVFTMNYKKAAELINEIKPKIAIPTHYKFNSDNQNDGEAFRKLISPEIQVELKL